MTQLSPMMEARAFRIWQYASQRDWDCSYEEIGAATGLDYNQVLHAIRAKGWGGRIGQWSGGAGATKRATLQHARKGYNFDHNNLDTVDLMQAGVFAGADE